MPSLSSVVDLLHGWYPPGTADSWDAVGLVTGDPDQEVRKVLFAVDPAPAVVATTEGARGGHWLITATGATGRWSAEPLPGPIADAYGCGDSFAAALAFSLGSGRPLEDALAFAAGRGAIALCRPGAHGVAMDQVQSDTTKFSGV